MGSMDMTRSDADEVSVFTDYSDMIVSYQCEDSDPHTTVLGKTYN